MLLNTARLAAAVHCLLCWHVVCMRMQTNQLKENLQALEEGFTRLVRGLPKSLPIRAVSGSVDFLKKLTPAVIRTARNLTGQYICLSVRICPTTSVTVSMLISSMCVCSVLLDVSCRRQLQ